MFGLKAMRRTAMFDDTRDGCTNFYCACAGTRTYEHGVCSTCGGVEPPQADLVAEMRGFADDHEPDGWSVRMMMQRAADEIGRLREENERLARWAAAQPYECMVLRQAIRKTLDDNGHLADGEVCTLLPLKLALRKVGTPWDGDELHNAK